MEYEITMTLSDLKEIIKDAVKSGVAATTMLNAPAKDLITKQEVMQRYCKSSRGFKKLLEYGLKEQYLTDGRSARPYYSVTQIEEILFGNNFYTNFITDYHKSIKIKVRENEKRENQYFKEH